MDPIGYFTPSLQEDGTETRLSPLDKIVKDVAGRHVKFNEDPVKSIREFKRSNDECLAIFPVLPTFPEINSKAKALERIEALEEDPCASLFIPRSFAKERRALKKKISGLQEEKFHNIQTPCIGPGGGNKLRKKIAPLSKQIASTEQKDRLQKALADTQLNITWFLSKFQKKSLSNDSSTLETFATSDTFLSLYSIYLFKAFDNPSFARKAAPLLQEKLGVTPPFNVLYSDTQQDTEITEWCKKLFEAYSEESRLVELLTVLSELVSLEERAMLRLEANFNVMIRRLYPPSAGSPLPSLPGFIKELLNPLNLGNPPPKERLQMLKTWIKSQQDFLKEIYFLDLREVELDFIPEEILSCLSNVDSVYFSKEDPEFFRTPAHWAFLLDDISKLPNLEFFSLTGHYLESDVLLSLLESIKNMKNLKQIGLSNTNITLEGVPEIVEYCKSKNIELLEILSDEEQDAEILQEYMGSCIGKKEIDLSGLSMRRIPKNSLHLFSDITCVAFKNVAKVPRTDLLDIMKTILQFPALETVDFSGNKLDDDALKTLIEPIKNAKNLKHIDISGNSFDPRKISELVEYCSSKSPNPITLTLRDSRSIADLLCIVEEMNLMGFAIDIPNLFQDVQKPLQKVLDFLASKGDNFPKGNNLDLSYANISAFPEELLQYFQETTAISLQGSYENPMRRYAALHTLLKLPKLEDVYLSDNLLTEGMIAELFEWLQTASNPNTIDLSTHLGYDIFYPGGVWSAIKIKNRLEPLHQLCITRGVELILPDPIESLELSSVEINSVSQDLPLYLKDVTSLSLKECYKTYANQYPALDTLLKLPKLQKIDLSGNYLTETMISKLSQWVSNKYLSSTGTALSSSLKIDLSNPVEFNLFHTKDVMDAIKVKNKLESLQQLCTILRVELIPPSAITHFALSDEQVDSVPQELPLYLKDVTSLALKDCYKTNVNEYPALHTLLALPKLNEVDLSHNYLTGAMIIELLNWVARKGSPSLSSAINTSPDSVTEQALINLSNAINGPPDLETRQALNMLTQLCQLRKVKLNLDQIP